MFVRLWASKTEEDAAKRSLVGLSGVGVGETSFLKTSRFEVSFWREMGNDTEFEASFRREMGNDTEFEASFWQEKGIDMIQDASFFNKKQEKQGNNWKSRENTKKQEKNRENKNRKLQEIQKRDFDEVPRNAENGNEFGKEFGNEFGNEFEVF